MVTRKLHVAAAGCSESSIIITQTRRHDIPELRSVVQSANEGNCLITGFRKCATDFQVDKIREYLEYMSNYQLHKTCYTLELVERRGKTHESGSHSR
jgi:hypothetical protein